MTARCALYMDALKVLGWGCEPPILGKRRPHSGSGMVPFERALMSSHRPSIVTFYLSLRVSDIIPLLCSSTQLFPTPPLVSPKFPHVPLYGSRWVAVGLRRAKVLGYLSVHLVSKISNLCVADPPTLQTDGQTDRRHAISIQRFALQCIAR